MIDLYAGLGGWAEGGLAEGYRVVGFDIERHEYGDHKYPAQLVIQDVLTLHGSQFKDAALIVCSPPCQAYSYRAMPWKRAKELPPPDNALFEACFRIQSEACEAAGRHIPMVVENVRGAQKWVGRAGWHFGSFYLWGDIPALMPIARVFKNPGFRFDGSGKSFQSESVNRLDDGVKVPMPRGGDSLGIGFQQIAKLRSEAGIKAGDRNKARVNGGHQWGVDFNEAITNSGVKVPGNKLSENGFAVPVARLVDKSTKPADFALSQSDRRLHLSYSRKAASAMIAKIPFVLAQHIARAWKPTEESKSS